MWKQVCQTLGRHSVFVQPHGVSQIRITVAVLTCVYKFYSIPPSKECSLNPLPCEWAWILSPTFKEYMKGKVVTSQWWHLGQEVGVHITGSKLCQHCVLLMWCDEKCSLLWYSRFFPPKCSRFFPPKCKVSPVIRQKTSGHPNRGTFYKMLTSTLQKFPRDNTQGKNEQGQSLEESEEREEWVCRW